MGTEDIPAEGLPEPAGIVGEPNVDDLPTGYRYGATRYADLILREAFPERYDDLLAVLSEFQIDIDELSRGGGSRPRRRSGSMRSCMSGGGESETLRSPNSLMNG